MRSDRSGSGRLARRRPPVGDAGMATAELAACLPVLVLLLAVGLTAQAAVGARVRLQDAAREAARAAARGDTGTARRLSAQVAPGAAVTISRGDGDVVAVTSIRVHPLGGVLPAFTVRERSVAALEPGSDDP